MKAEDPMALGDHADTDALAALAHGRSGNPFALLGPHDDRVRGFFPEADSAVLTKPDGTRVAGAQKIHPAGVFEAEVKQRLSEYKWHVTWGEHSAELDDPYRFGPILGDLDVWLLGEGRHRHAYQVLGAHPRNLEGAEGVSFAVWAPNASRVSVVGEFNHWDGRRHPMRLRQECGVWELFIPGLEEGSLYKYEILDRDGHRLPLKTDPYAFEMEKRPETASVVRKLPTVGPNEAWSKRKGEAFAPDAPVSIYEVHLGSWMKSADGGFLSYDELIERLVPYVLELGFTHVEFLPVSEHPFDGSWGYQPIGLFAPTSRFGDAEGFARLVRAFHDEGLGVLLDWVPGHFPTDAHGLGVFDGTNLYEHADPKEGFHQDWNTLIYNFGRNEVKGMLIANALFWPDHYHVDGLRVDAVASMLYRDYSRKEGEWVPNQYGGRENLEAISFLKDTNSAVREEMPGAVTVAEESTAFPGVSHPVEDGGLGFHYKWNMGWMHDTLEYMKEDPLYRSYHHDKMTFSLVYAFTENFVLPLSHDEVVHGKSSLLNKMPGDEWQKFANLRAYYGFMWAHPGKKLLFMGGEIAQSREWNHDASIDWHLLDDDRHAGMQRLVAALNPAYKAEPALHRLDCDPAGFDWVIGDDRDNSVFAFLRKGQGEDRPVLAVSNMTPKVLTDYRIGVPQAGSWKCLLSTDDQRFGGSNAGGQSAETLAEGAHGHPYSLSLTLPPLATVYWAPG
jgi:1,4-alpha-glucan branching enzyme